MSLSSIIKRYRLEAESVLVAGRTPAQQPETPAGPPPEERRRTERERQEAERARLVEQAAAELAQAQALRQAVAAEQSRLAAEREEQAAANRSAATAVAQQAAEEKERLLAAAQAEAERIVGEAESRRFEIKEAAHQEGHAAGLAAGKAQGYDEGKAELAQLGKTLQDIIIEINNQRAELVRRAEPQVVDLALAVARKVVNVEMAHNRDIIRDLVREAIGRLKTRERMVVRVHPDDLENLREYKNDLLLVFSEIQDLTIREDRNMARGGVVVETESSVVDSRLETRLGRVEKEVERLK